MSIFRSPESGTSSIASPILSLTLQPGLVEVSPASDKRRPSAVRLSAPSITPLSLLLDAGDTVVMGKWIRAIIEALGHINHHPIHKIDASTDTTSGE